MGTTHAVWGRPRCSHVMTTTLCAVCVVFGRGRTVPVGPDPVFSNGCVVQMGTESTTALGRFRVLKQTLESPYTTKRELSPGLRLAAFILGACSLK